jgi:hypothetical protein
MTATTIATVVLISAALVAAWGLSLLARPIGRCPGCWGRRVRRQLLTHRIVRCGVCGGTGLWRRVGATFVHRTYWSIRDHERQREHLAAVADRAARPARPAHWLPPDETETTVSTDATEGRETP